MIVFGTIGIAIIFAIFLLIFFRERVVWWELVILIAIPTLISFGSKALVDTYSVEYSEYLGDEVTSVYEEEPYNEWIDKTCYEDCNCTTDKDGNETCDSCPYDCSYQNDEGPRWYAKTKCGNNVSITEAQYDKWVIQFGGNRIKINTRTNYDSSDKCVWSNGTKFEGKIVGTYSYIWQTNWDGNYTTSVPLTTTQKYVNKIKASDYTVFNFVKLTEDSAKSLKLFDYPKFDNYFTYPSVLGYNDDSVQLMFKKINGHLGRDKQIRVWVLVHNTSDSDIGWMQECYWVGGNKNELVINIGVDGNEIKWCHTFSWSDIQSLKDDIEKYVVKRKTLNRITLTDIAYYVRIESEKRFERLNFKQFDYLTVEPPLVGIIICYILTLLICVGLSFFVITNDENNENIDDEFQSNTLIDIMRKLRNKFIKK